MYAALASAALALIIAAPAASLVSVTLARVAAALPF